MKLLYRRNGDPCAKEMRVTMSPVRFDQEPTEHLAVEPLASGWGLYMVHITPDAQKVERRTKTLLAAYASEQEAETAALAIVGVGV